MLRPLPPPVPSIPLAALALQHMRTCARMCACVRAPARIAPWRVLKHVCNTGGMGGMASMGMPMGNLGMNSMPFSDGPDWAGEGYMLQG